MPGPWINGSRCGACGALFRLRRKSISASSPDSQAALTPSGAEGEVKVAQAHREALNHSMGKHSADVTALCHQYGIPPERAAVILQDVWEKWRKATASPLGDPAGIDVQALRAELEEMRERLGRLIERLPAPVSPARRLGQGGSQGERKRKRKRSEIAVLNRLHEALRLVQIGQDVASINRRVGCGAAGRRELHRHRQEELFGGALGTVQVRLQGRGMRHWC
jgi:hypothetical protein